MTKILILDLERAPNVLYSWSLREKYIPAENIIQPSYVMCYAAKWLGSDEILFDSIQRSSTRNMLKGVHDLLDDADVLVTFNGVRFDSRVLDAEMFAHKIKPPSPYHELDLYVTSKRFNFPSRKLNYLCQRLGIGQKLEHEGFQLWKDCMDGKLSAWRKMEEYNIQDVQLTEALYLEMRPWIKNHPNLSIDSLEEVCPHCGSDKRVWRGYREAITRRYRRFRCSECGSWGRATKCERGTAKVRGF